MGEEAEYLESQGDGGVADDLRERERVQFGKFISEMEARYRDAGRAQVGATIRCSCCAKLIVKASYQQKFCSNQKHKGSARFRGKNSCKDRYWNFVKPRGKFRHLTEA